MKRAIAILAGLCALVAAGCRSDPGHPGPKPFIESVATRSVSISGGDVPSGSAIPVHVELVGPADGYDYVVRCEVRESRLGSTLPTDTALVDVTSVPVKAGDPSFDFTIATKRDLRKKFWVRVTVSGWDQKVEKADVVWVVPVRASDDSGSLGTRSLSDTSVQADPAIESVATRSVDVASANMGPNSTSNVTVVLENETTQSNAYSITYQVVDTLNPGNHPTEWDVFVNPLHDKTVGARTRSFTYTLQAKSTLASNYRVVVTVKHRDGQSTSPNDSVNVNR